MPELLTDTQRAALPATLPHWAMLPGRDAIRRICLDGLRPDVLTSDNWRHRRVTTNVHYGWGKQRGGADRRRARVSGLAGEIALETR